MPKVASPTQFLPELAAKFEQLRALAKQEGIEIVFADYGGLRTAADTTQLIKWRNEAVAGARALAKKRGRDPEAAARAAYYRVSPFDSTKHGAGAAFDVLVIYMGKATRNISDGTNKLYKRLAELGKSIGLVAGYYFSKPNDPYHFELPGSMQELRNRFMAMQRVPADVTRVTPKPATGKSGFIAPHLPIGIALAVGVFLLVLALRG